MKSTTISGRSESAMRGGIARPDQTNLTDSTDFTDSTDLTDQTTAKARPDKGPRVSTGRSGLTTRDIVQTGIFTALIAVCSWISIPTTVPFTLQTFAVFLAALVLGGRKGTLAVVAYLLLGALGLPVFHGFTGGMGILLGSTGGYIVGFVLATLLMWLMEPVSRKYPIMSVVSMLLGLLACYTLGTAWFVMVYGKANDPVGIMTALGWCVFPFIIPDLLKIAAAFVVKETLNRAIRQQQ